MTSRGILIVFSGPSGVGKDSVLRTYMQSSSNCVLSISATTRELRPGEVDGIDYHFISLEDFEQMASQGEFLEYAEFSGNYYGTPAGWVEENLSAGKNVFIEIELKGAAKVRKDHPEALFIFLMPPCLDVLENRLRSRGTEDEAAIRRRLAVARAEIELGKDYDFVITNHTIKKSCEQLAAVVEAAPCHIKYKRRFIEEVLENA